jgi:hypothetical protein
MLRTSAVFSALRPSFISANQTRWPPNFVYVLSYHILCPQKHPLVQNEVVRIEVLRLNRPYESPKNEEAVPVQEAKRLSQRRAPPRWGATAQSRHKQPRGAASAAPAAAG